jgi:hypothetical protein
MLHSKRPASAAAGQGTIALRHHTNHLLYSHKSFTPSHACRVYGCCDRPCRRHACWRRSYYFTTIVGRRRSCRSVRFSLSSILVCTILLLLGAMAGDRLDRLCYTALVLLSLASHTTADLWSVNIDLGPAPLPQDGPPFSAHATRDKALLPYQIVGIVGSYIASILIIGVLLLTVGRTRRKRALERAAEARSTEMVKPMSRAFDPSPISPISSRSWYSPRKLKAKKSSASSMRSGGGMSNPVSPAGISVISFDAAVVEADRVKRQEEMERLYAAVMAQDDRRSQQKALSPLPLPPPPEIPTGSPPEYSRRKPPRLITNAPNLRHLQPSQGSPCSPTTPKSPIRAIYPPDSSIPPMPSGPTSPLRAEYPTNAMYQPHQDSAYMMNRERSVSDSSQRSARKFRKSLKNTRISSPIIDDNSDGARTPLSPRYYGNPGIPPDPPTARTTDTTDSQTYPPLGTPGTGRSWRYNDDNLRQTSPPPPPPAKEPISQIRNPPRPNPQRKVPRIITPQNPSASASSSSALQPPQQPLPPPSASSPTNPLPFRQLHYQTTSQPQSSAATKTTYLETRPRPNRLLPAAALRSPHTAGLATPYSPYMPFTPLTPVTPRLASRAERKQRMKEERELRGAVVEEEDAVRDEGEVWGSGY